MAQSKYKQAKLEMDRQRKEKMTEYYELGQLDTGRKSVKGKALSKTIQKPINFALFSEDELKIYETKQKLRFENVQEN